MTETPTPRGFAVRAGLILGSVIALPVILSVLPPLPGFRALLGGWWTFPFRVAGDMAVDWRLVATGAMVCAAAFVAGAALLFCIPRSAAIRATRPALKLAGVSVAGLALGVASLAVTNQMRWLGAGREPMTSSRRDPTKSS